MGMVGELREDRGEDINQSIAFFGSISTDK